MKKKSRITKLFLMVSALTITLFTTGFSSFAQETLTIEGKDFIVDHDMYGENYVRLDERDATRPTDGFTFYYYTLVADSDTNLIMNKEEFKAGFTIYSDNTYQRMKGTYYISDGVEVAKLSGGTVYLNKFYIPAGTYIIANIYPTQNQNETNELYFSVSKEAGNYYIFGETTEIDDLYQSYEMTNNDFIIFGYYTQGDTLSEEYTEFLQTQESQLLGQIPEPQIIEDTTEQDIANAELDAANQDVTITTTEETIQQEVVTPAEPEEKKNIKGVVIGGIAILLLVIIAIVFSKKK